MRTRSVLLAISLMTSATTAHGQSYRSVQLDQAGQLSVTSMSGTPFRAPRLGDQVSFDQPSLSRDHRTVGWLATYADPSVPPASTDPFAGRLVLYRAGRVFRTFGTDQTIWSWQFAHDDQAVGFCTGPAHGGAQTCELRLIGSGRLQATWKPSEAGTPPPWAVGLRN